MSGLGGKYGRHPRVPTLEEYGRLFKAARGNRNWSQVEMAHQLRCPQARISEIEAAKIAPTASMLWLVIELQLGTGLKTAVGL